MTSFYQQKLVRIVWGGVVATGMLRFVATLYMQEYIANQLKITATDIPVISYNFTPEFIKTLHLSHLSTYKEKELLVQIAAGGRTEFNVLVGQYGPQLLAHALTFVKTYQEAEDMVQDIFLKIWDKREKLTYVDSFPDYLFILSRNYLVSHLRKKLPPTVPPTDNMDMERWLLPDRQYQLKELDALIQRGIAQLRPQQQAVFRLSRLDGLSYKQIGEQLQISPETVKWHLVAATTTLRAFIRQHSDLMLLAAFYRCL